MLKNKLIFSSSTILLLLALTLMLFYVDVGYYMNGKIGLFFINNFFICFVIQTAFY